MYKVYYVPRGVFPKHAEGVSIKCPILYHENEKAALSFALSLHEACNIRHLIFVLDPNEERILTLFSPGEYEKE